MYEKSINNNEEEDGMGFSGLLPSSQEKLDEVRQKNDAINSAKYFELIMAVGKKYSGETRHQTALRYIREAESSADKDVHVCHECDGTGILS